MTDHITDYINMTDEEKDGHYQRFIQGLAESYGMHISSPAYPVEIVVIWATRLKQAWQSADERPENAHAGDEIDYARDELERATKEWMKTWKD